MPEATRGRYAHIQQGRLVRSTTGRAAMSHRPDCMCGHCARRDAARMRYLDKALIREVVEGQFGPSEPRMVKVSAFLPLRASLVEAIDAAKALPGNSGP